MRTIEVTFDEDLLTRLDADQEVRTVGLSAVLRQAVVEYLERRRQNKAIAEQYRRAYSNDQGLGEEFEGWEEQGEWSPE